MSIRMLDEINWLNLEIIPTPLLSLLQTVLIRLCQAKFNTYIVLSQFGYVAVLWIQILLEYGEIPENVSGKIARG